MSSRVSPTLQATLRWTLHEIERSLGSPENDPALRALRQSIVLAIAEMEVKMEVNRVIPTSNEESSPRFRSP
jgi:hypothetical protein